jgi:hypothetical protein
MREHFILRDQFLIAAFVLVPILAVRVWGGDDVSTSQPSAAGLETCLAAAADDTPIYPSDKFVPAKEMHATFRLGDAHAAELEFTWVAVDVGAAAPANFAIASSTLDLHNLSSGTLSLTGMENPMPLGKYRLDVSLDHQKWKSCDFTVVPPPPDPVVQKPADLMPLSRGHKWTYQFVQEAANGGSLGGPGIKLDPDGKLRARVEIIQAGDEDQGSHLELRRNGELVSQEWWRLGDGGLIATQRKLGDQMIPLKPPQILWPWPLAPKTWTYQADDHTYQQSCQMWGPLPVTKPGGEAAGYVVMIVQADAFSTTSAERHFVPSIGLTKEIIIITNTNHQMISRTEMTLEKTE